MVSQTMHGCTSILLIAFLKGKAYTSMLHKAGYRILAHTLNSQLSQRKFEFWSYYPKQLSIGK